MIRLPYTVECIKEYKCSMHPGVDFGQLGKEYHVDCIIPNGHYYVLRGLGQIGEVNHLVNMDRFKPVLWNFEEE
jgi:hypothetical protein